MRKVNHILSTDNDLNRATTRTSKRLKVKHDKTFQEMFREEIRHDREKVRRYTDNM